MIIRRCRYVGQFALALVLACAAPARGDAPTPLQPLIDATPTGGVLRPSPGEYAGPAVISRPLTLDGMGRVTLDGGGGGTVLIVRTSGATVRGLRISRSGDSHDAVDAALLLEGNDNRIEGNRIDDALFGIVLKQANRNVVRANHIRSKKAEVAFRGDGIRLWYSNRNLIEGNDIADSRDVTLSTSSGNRILGNVIRNGRYSVHLVFSHDTHVEGNAMEHNETGVVVMHSRDVVIRANRIAAIMGASAVGIGLKDTGSVLVEDNDIVRCAVGLRSDSPMDPATRIIVRGNRFASNPTALVFYGERGGHGVHGNRFEHNLIHATVYGTGDPANNDWRGNYWDDYEGFDADRDGVGDQPHEVRAFADRIWMELPMAAFFRNSPVLELLDFLERLAPFSEPDLFLRDPAPRMVKPPSRQQR